MNKSLLEKDIFIESLKSLETTRQEIERVQDKLKKNFEKLEEIIVKNIVAYNWKPFYNEKAVYISLDEDVAWHVWFFKVEGNLYSFREVPNDFPYLRHYCRQEIIPSPSPYDSETHGWIIPMEIFEELNKIIDFYLYDDKHLTYKPYDFSSLS